MSRTTIIDSWASVQELVEQTRHIQMSQAQQEAQRLSFVFGNTHLDNELVTRSMVEEANRQVLAEQLVNE